MNILVQEVFNRFYRNEDRVGYLLKCKSEIVLPNELTFFFQKHQMKMEQHNLGDVWPSCKWTFDQGYVAKGEFKVHYSSLLMVSKLAPLYYLQHEFQVDNKDDDMLSPTLDGFDIQPYTKRQAEVESIIQEVFSKQGYEKLSYSQMNEVLPELHFGEDVKIFGSQVTVEYAVFHDILEICPE